MEQKRDAESTKKAILDAGEALFLENGFARTAISAVAREADVTKSLIHHHFGSKKELWNKVKARMLNAYFEAQKEMLLSGDNDLRLLKTSIISYFRTLQENPSLTRLLTWIFLEKENECYDLGEEITRLGIHKIQESQQKGHIRKDIQPSHILFSFLALVEHWFLAKDHLFRNILSGDHADFEPAQADEAFLEDLIKIFFQGIVPVGTQPVWSEQ